MNQQIEAVETTSFLERTVRKELARLRGDLALHRGVLWNQRRTVWGQDRAWAVKKVYELEETKKHIQMSELALANFIKEHRSFMGNMSKHGRLCFHCFTGGQPIDTHYCELAEGHLGPHADSIGKWHREPRHPEPKLTISKIRQMVEEKRKNLERFGSDWGHRSGPSIIMFRDTTWYEHPMRRCYSCLGCQHLRGDQRSPVCAHPEFLAKYQSPQSVAYHGPKCLLTPRLCPALGRDADNVTQPHPCRLPKRESECVTSIENVFKFVGAHGVTRPT